MSKVYLAGPITGEAFGTVNDWRKDAVKFLSLHGIEGLSPLRAKDYLLGETSILDSYEGSHVLSSQKGLTTRDRWDCQRADVVLFNFIGANRVSIGTCIELGWADSARRPMVTAMEPGSLHDHAMVREMSGYIVPSVEDALAVVVALLGDANAQ